MLTLKSTWIELRNNLIIKWLRFLNQQYLNAQKKEELQYWKTLVWIHLSIPNTALDLSAHPENTMNFTVCKRLAAMWGPKDFQVHMDTITEFFLSSNLSRELVFCYLNQVLTSLHMISCTARAFSRLFGGIQGKVNPIFRLLYLKLRHPLQEKIWDILQLFWYMLLQKIDKAYNQKLCFALYFVYNTQQGAWVKIKMIFTIPKVNEFASSSFLSLISHISYKNTTQSIEEALRKNVTGLH